MIPFEWIYDVNQYISQFDWLFERVVGLLIVYATWWLLCCINYIYHCYLNYWTFCAPSHVIFAIIKYSIIQLHLQCLSVKLSQDACDFILESKLELTCGIDKKQCIINAFEVVHFALYMLHSHNIVSIRKP